MSGKDENLEDKIENDLINIMMNLYTVTTKLNRLNETNNDDELKGRINGLKSNVDYAMRLSFHLTEQMKNLIEQMKEKESNN